MPIYISPLCDNYHIMLIFSQIETLSTPSPDAISELVYPDTLPVSLKLEGSDVGRGNKW